MQVTTEILKSWFNEFNRNYFGSALPEPAFAVGKARTQLGAMAYKWKSVMGFRKYYGYTIRISNYYDAGEEQFKNVLLHEMIHYYIVFKGIKDTSSHGVVFRRMMASLNARGWAISVRTDTGGWAVAGKGRVSKERYIVLAAVLSSGKCLLTVVSPGNSRRLGTVMKMSREVSSHAFYVTGDSFFATFPKVRSPRGRIVSRAMFDKKTGEMTRIEL